MFTTLNKLVKIIEILNCMIKNYTFKYKKINIDF